jgi:hypothetical protein
VRRVIRLLDPVHLGTAILLRDWWREFDRFLRIMWRVSRHRPEMRRHVWSLLFECVLWRPRLVRTAMVMTVFYVSLGPFSRYVIEQIKGKLAEFDAAGQSLFNRRGGGRARQPSKPGDSGLSLSAVTGYQDAPWHPGEVPNCAARAVTGPAADARRT